MRPAEGFAAFFAQPEGTYLRGRTWAYFCVDAQLFGQVHWGRPEPDDLEQLTALWQVELEAQRPPHATYADARQLQGSDPGCFEVMQREAKRNHDALAQKIQRQALVRPPGLPGLLVAGFYRIVTPSHPVEVFASPAEALEWLGRAELTAELDQLAQTLSTEEPLLAELRRHLAQHLADASLSSAARAFAMSERTLQRRLADAGTSFLTELHGARIAAAKVLLADSDTKLAAIAVEVGCGSLSQLSRLFRQVAGVTPSEWRARRQPAG